MDMIRGKTSVDVVTQRSGAPTRGYDIGASNMGCSQAWPWQDAASALQTWHPELRQTQNQTVELP